MFSETSVLTTATRSKAPEDPIVPQLPCSSRELQRHAPAELQLVLPVLKVHVVDGMPDVSAPITSLVPFEVGTPALCEAHLGTERLLASRRLQGEQLLVAGHLLAPGALCTARWDTRHVCGHRTLCSHYGNKQWDGYGWDIRTQFVPHRRHITSPLQSSAG
jgi:hypothetical protein